MADDTSSKKAAESKRFLPPSLDDAGETEGHRWEPRTPEHDDILGAAPPPPAPPEPQR
jgi:hypothetical protein